LILVRLRMLYNPGSEVGMKNKSAEFIRWIDKRNITMEQFAKLAGVCLSTASKWRQGTSAPSAFVAAALRKKFPTCPLFR
jgi:DNA-binding transcriptional regulator YiaG